MHTDLKIVREYYLDKLKQFGPTAKGVDWKNPESQELRFQQLLKLIENDHSSLLDYGCGYGGFHHYLTHKFKNIHFTGYDILDESIQIACQTAPHANWTSKYTDLKKYDYVVASGLFNVKLDFSTADWEKYFKDTLVKFNELSTSGFAFNCLTGYSDEDKKESRLYYPQPEDVFNFCMKNFGRKVSLIHDYPLYEFTVIVRKSK